MHRLPTPWRERYARVLRWLARSTNALPCVGLVVLGGCLTFVVIPDDLDSTEDQANSEKTASGLRTGKLPLIVLDPGHGGKDDGAKGNGLVEKDLTLDLANRTARLLKSVGFPTVLTRTDNVFISLEDRARIGNDAGEQALFISLHFNSDNSSTSTGVETFYAREKITPLEPWSFAGFFTSPEKAPLDNGEHLAGAIHASLTTRTEARNRGIHARDFYVVRHVRCPSVLIEGGFISNAFEAQLLAGEGYRDRLAGGIAEGVMLYHKQRARTQPVVGPLALAR